MRIIKGVEVLIRNRIFLSFLSFLITFPSISPVLAASADKFKEPIVLMPVRGIKLSQMELSTYRTAIAESLSREYTVFTGDEVDRIIEEIFEKESRENIDCDTEKCFQDIAIAFQSELIASTTVFPKEEVHLLKFEIINILDNKVIMARTETCEECGAGEIIDMLKTMAAGEEVKKGTNWLLWGLLILALVGGGVALAGGGGGGGGGASAGSVLVTW